MAETLKFARYAPDLSPLGTGVSSLVSGCVPQADGFGPFKSMQEFTESLPADCRGYFFARRSDGSVAVFAGTSDRLLLLNNTTFAWEDVSQGGTPYTVLVSTDNWVFRQFNDLVLAVQRNTPPQKYTLSAGGAFADLGGSPPQASHIAIVNRFVLLTGLDAEPRRAQWSDLDNPEEWTAGVGLADYQDFPDGGVCHAVSGGDAYGLVFQDDCIRSFVYAPGSATTFQITRISATDTLVGNYSIIESGERTFFCTAQGFKVVLPGGKPIPIGKERIDRTFAADVDMGNLQLLIGAADPSTTRVYWAYKSQQGLSGLFDKVLVFDFAIGKEGEWTILPLSGQYLAALARPGITLEQLDAIAPTPIAVTGAADNGAGLIRLEVAATSNANFDIAGQNFIVVYGVEGTVEANGTWVVDIIDATHIDLLHDPETGTPSAFVNAYTDGGHIGGSLDALGFSLDSLSNAAIAALSAVNPSGQVGFFTGPNIEAIIETSEQDGQGRMLLVDGMTPITDSPDVMTSIGYRSTAQQAAVTYGNESALTEDGETFPESFEVRYARARCRIPAASVWSYARGIQPEALLGGQY